MLICPFLCNTVYKQLLNGCIVLLLCACFFSRGVNMASSPSPENSAVDPQHFDGCANVPCCESFISSQSCTFTHKASQCVRLVLETERRKGHREWREPRCACCVRATPRINPLNAVKTPPRCGD